MLQMSKSTVPLALTVAIVNRGKGGKVSELFKQESATFHLMALGKGTADKKILSYLGLGEIEKDVVFSVMPFSVSKKSLEKLNDEWSLYTPGKGIAFRIGLNGVADAASQKHLQGTAPEQGGLPMEQSSQHDLIVAITNQGYSTEVMEAAKSAGATGGTLLHTRGTCLKEAEKFFGICIQPEKDMLFILVPSEIRPAVMDAIVKDTGLQTDAKTVVFSLPVNGVVGLFNGGEAV